jgi:hypothetical protein
MNKSVLFAMAICAPLLLGAKDTGSGCSQPLPNAQTVYLNLPKEIRSCPYAPKSPGAKATKKQTAVYIAGLYNAWSVCHGKVEDINRLYKLYQNALKDANHGKCPVSMVCD